MSDTKILIEGIGGIGGIVATSLIKAGYQVTLVTGNENITSAINWDGIFIVKDEKRKQYSHQAYTNLDKIEGEEFDIIFLIMKANQVREAAINSKKFLSESGYMATFQNGIVEYELEEIVGDNKIIPITVSFGGTMIEPGIYEKTSEGGFYIGELHGGSSKRIQQLKIILDHVDETTISENMEGILWSKLAINCCINTLGAITGMKLGKLLAKEQVRKLFLSIYQEVVDVAHAMEVTLEAVATDPYRLYLPKNAGWLKSFYKDLILRFVGKKYKNVKSSTLQSIEKGRKSEIEYLNGFVIEQAKRSGISVPTNQAVTEVMQKIDNKTLKPNPDNLDQINQLLHNNN